MGIEVEYSYVANGFLKTTVTGGFLQKTCMYCV